MNKAGLQKLVGSIVKVDPAAVATNGRSLDDDWVINEATETGITLENRRTRTIAILAYDSIYSFFSDAARSTAAQTYGVLQLHSQISIAANGTTDVRPLPPPKRAGDAFPVNRFHPMTLQDGSTERYYSWQSRDPVHLAAEERPRQLMGLYEALCHGLRIEAGREPEFSAPARLTGEPVFELSPDYRARWTLLGGAGGAVGSAILVLSDRPARFANGDEPLIWSALHLRPRPCELSADQE